MDRLRLFGRSIFAMGCIAAAAYGEPNPYNTDQGYYNTKGGYSQYNSADVQSRVNGLPGNLNAYEGATEVLKQQETARQNNAATCDDPVRCQVEASRLPGSLADAVKAREETYQGGKDNTGLVGLDEKLVEVERIAGYGRTGAETAALSIEMKLSKMNGPGYNNPKDIDYSIKKALQDELAAQQQAAEVFGISENWANRGYRQLIENPEDSPPTGKGSVATPGAGSVASAAPGSKAPGEIPNEGSGPNGKPSDASTGADYAKVGDPGTINAPGAMNPSTLEQGRQMAYDILRAEGITPVGSLREVGVGRGDVLPEAGALTAGEMKKPDELGGNAKGMSADALLAARLGVGREKLRVDDEDSEVTGPGAGRGAKSKRAAFRSVAPYEDEEPPAAVLRGLSAAQLKDVKLKWRLFRLTQERERVLSEAGPMMARLRALGVKATTHGQTLFQQATRNYRTFSRWRKPPAARSAEQVPAKAAPVKTATKPKRPAVTAQR